MTILLTVIYAFLFFIWGVVMSLWLRNGVKAYQHLLTILCIGIILYIIYNIKLLIGGNILWLAYVSMIIGIILPNLRYFSKKR
jgi:hypothetical protein